MYHRGDERILRVLRARERHRVHASADIAAFRDLSLNDLSRACSASGNAAFGAWITARVERPVVHDLDQMGVSDVFAHVLD